MKLDTLYKRTRTGAIQYWQIQTMDMAGGGTDILTGVGQLGTQSPVNYSESITEGKQGRSPKEQAEFIARSDWKRKRDEGYKSLKDLDIPNLEFRNGKYYFPGGTTPTYSLEALIKKKSSSEVQHRYFRQRINH